MGHSMQKDGISYLSDLLKFELSVMFSAFFFSSSVTKLNFKHASRIAYLLFLSRFLQTHKLEPSSHYLRLKVWNAGQMLFYVPKLEEDISDVVRKHTLKQDGNKSLRTGQHHGHLC